MIDIDFMLPNGELVKVKSPVMPQVGETVVIGDLVYRVGWSGYSFDEANDKGGEWPEAAFQGCTVELEAEPKKESCQ